MKLARLFFVFVLAGMFVNTLLFAEDENPAPENEKNIVFLVREDGNDGKVKQLLEYEKREDWKMASAMLSQFIQKTNLLDELYPVDENHFITIGELLAQHVINWPEDKKNEIANGVTDLVKALANNASNAGDWERIARYYPYTHEGLIAHLRVAENAVENGSVERASFWLENMLKLGQITVAEYPQAYAMLVFCRAGKGDMKGASEALEQLKALGTKTIESDGRKWDAAKLAAEMEAVMKSVANAVLTAKSTTFLVPEKVNTELEVPAYYWTGDVEKQYFAKDKPDMPKYERPVIEQQATLKDGILYYSDTKSLHAYDIDSKKELWMYGTKILPPQFDDKGRMGSYVPDSPQGSMKVVETENGFLVNLADKYALAMRMMAFGAKMSDLPKGSYMTGRREIGKDLKNSKVALISKTGNLIWEVNSGRDDGKKFLGSSVFLHIPTSSYGKLYAVTVETMGYPSLSLVCIERGNGGFVWKRDLWSSEPPAGREKGFNMFKGFKRDASSGPVMGDDPAPVTDNYNVYFASFLGCLGAYDLKTGRPSWIVKLPSKRVPSYFAHRNTNNGWIVNQPILWKNLLIVAMRDTEEIAAYNTINGGKLWSYPRGRYNYVLGMFNGNIIIAGDNITALDMATGKEVWSTPIKEAAEPDEENRIWTNSIAMGRGCLYDGNVYQATLNGLYVVDAASGKVLHTKKWADPWKEAGNITISEEKMIICGYNRITVYDTAKMDKK